MVRANPPTPYLSPHTFVKAYLSAVSIVSFLSCFFFFVVYFFAPFVVGLAVFSLRLLFLHLLLTLLFLDAAI